MTKSKKFLFCFIGLYFFAALSLAHAQNAPGVDGSPLKWHGGQRIQEIYSQLTLTDAQKELLEANKQKHRAIMKFSREQIKASKEALTEELMKPQLDMLKINKLHGQIKFFLSQMENDKLSSILEARAILTPEQFSKFITLTHKHKQEHSK